MSRKPARPVKQSPSATGAAAATGERERAALVHLEKARYRDAIECYKGLLKTERRPEWLLGLASAYAGRAQALANKGMRREAIEIWRSRAEICGTPLWEGPYVGWMLDDGRFADVMGYLASRCGASSQASDDAVAALEAQLAPAMLAADEATLARLPAESPLVRHHPAALAALTAYAANDVAALESALANIPFRSPYRDLRLVLKAMVLWETDRSAASAALSRLPLDGPFERLAAPFRVLVAPDEERLHRLATLNPTQHALALDLLGCPQGCVPLLRALAAANEELSPAALFDLVAKHARDLPDPVATRAWQRLSPWAVRHGCDSPRIFGSPSSADEECATALVQDIKGDWDHAETHWSDAVEEFSTSGKADDRLRAALILRHVALGPGHLSRDGVLDDAGEELLTDSLQFDVHDRDVHVRLVQFWRKKGNLKRARARLDFGLGYFPEDVPLLTEAVETALAGGAFKKAAAAARRLLKLEPFNRKVQSLIGNAHLSHAGKQIAADKLGAAKQEIAEAVKWLGSDADQGRIQLLQSWTEETGSPERLRLAQQAAAGWGGGLSAGWRLLREAQGVFSKVGPTTSDWLLDEAGINPKKALVAADLLALVQVLEDQPVIERKGVSPLIPWHAAIIKMAGKPVFDAEPTIRVCEALSRHGEHELVEKFAQAARKRWPERPIFVYHAVAARFAKHRGIMTGRDFDDLDEAHEQAHRSKDIRLAMRIQALFDAESASQAPVVSNSAGFPAFPFDPGQMNVAVVREMVEAAIKIGDEKDFLRQARETIGAALYKQIEKEYAGNRAGFLRHLLDMLVAAMVSQMGAPPPFVPSKIVKPKKPVPGQGKLFDE
jgi:hypothetical protein